MGASRTPSDGPATEPEETFTDLLAYADLLRTPELARLYTFVLWNGPVTVDRIKRDLDVPHSTAYKYVGTLEEVGVLTRDESERPARVSVDPVRLVLETDAGRIRATPAFVAAIGRQVSDEDVATFVDRHGVAKLGAALHYAFRIEAGDLTQRTAASRLGVHPVEGTTVLGALRDLLDDLPDAEPTTLLDE